MVENKSIAEFFSRMFNPFGPITTPEIIKPIMPGMFSRLKRIGEKSIINSIRENTSTGFVKGNPNSCNRVLKKNLISSNIFLVVQSTKILCINSSIVGIYKVFKIYFYPDKICQ